ncbi:DALR anticodon-binding domain-containing protein 3 isoform X1 [Cricetulus griseus]|uniref:DALR anticodon-binding domain-containing protein 3 isoform X1 n=1 Tax=Cricetulus griseus TaxID=10029 RepID=A0A9J7H026_CRIGR|nr:DALR anticodon-binding domain-containing protein 3 isoform X1 [Cricetulus griseus]XP_035299858.1 DALR anticodon-binding domain-containing protein 3 isoform X1 [Cricetulus griseus]
MATGRLGVGETLEALNAAVGPGSPVWFKETNARHLRVRDFLAPRSALQARFRDGQVPERVFSAVTCLQGPGVAPVLRCAPTPAGLSLQLQRPAVFERVLGALASYATPAKPASPGPRLVLHCPALRCNPSALRLSQLRAVLVADHLTRTLRAHGVCVRSVPSVRDPHMATFLQKLRVDWPTASKSTSTETLRTCVLAELNSVSEEETLPPGVLGRLCLKELVQRRPVAGYDPGIDNCLVTEDMLSVLSELQEAVHHWPEGGYPGLDGDPDSGVEGCMVVHVVSCEEAFQQQKLDLLWQKLDDQAPHKQKHLVCGPVKVAGVPGTQMTAPEYYELRYAQVCKASALKHGGDLAQDPAWTKNFDVLSVATIKFEMLSTAPQNQLLLADSTISTKGTKSGTFVMYNCARLATLFEGYKQGMERGLYPAFPLVSSLDFSLLHDEGEWLLLFNSVLPFLDLLSQSVSLASTPGLHITVRTEMVCKFLVQLSMDFSSYYNRVHILGVSIQQKGVCGECGGHRIKTGRQEDKPGSFSFRNLGHTSLVRCLPAYSY